MNMFLEQHLSLFPNLCTRKKWSLPILKTLRSFNKSFHIFFPWQKKPLHLTLFLHSMGLLHPVVVAVEAAMASMVVECEVTSNLHWSCKNCHRKFRKKWYIVTHNSKAYCQILISSLNQLYCALPSWFKPYALSKQSLKCVKSSEKYHISSKSTSCMHCAINLDKSLQKVCFCLLVFFLLLCSKNMA